MAQRRNQHPEDAIQSAFFEWVHLQETTTPELRLFHAIPNGIRAGGKMISCRGKQIPLAAIVAKRMGSRRGIPDAFLPVARWGMHGLYIEFKAPGEKPTEEQRAMHEMLKEQGYMVQVHDDARTAAMQTRIYLGIAR